MLEFLKLTPAYQRWNEAVPISERNDWRAYEAYIARVDQTLCLIDLFWPEFIELDGLIIRKSKIKENWDDYMREAHEANWTLSTIEYVVNHLHVSDLFMNDPDRNHIDDSVYAFLANIIAEMWKCRLNQLFPDKNFEVGVNTEQVGMEIYAYTVRNPNI